MVVDILHLQTHLIVELKTASLYCVTKLCLVQIRSTLWLVEERREEKLSIRIRITAIWKRKPVISDYVKQTPSLAVTGRNLPLQISWLNSCNIQPYWSFEALWPRLQLTYLFFQHDSLALQENDKTDKLKWDKMFYLHSNLHDTFPCIFSFTFFRYMVVAILFIQTGHQDRRLVNGLEQETSQKVIKANICSSVQMLLCCVVDVCLWWPELK